MSKCVLYIPVHFNERDAEKIGIKDGDFKNFIANTEKLYWDMENAGIVTSCLKEAVELFKSTRIEYATDKAFSAHGNYLLVKDMDFFTETILGKSSVNVFKAWLTFLRHIAEDIDELEERYRKEDTAEFLRSMLTYFAVYDVTTDM